MSCKSASKFFFQIVAVLPGEWRSGRSTDFNILTDGGLATTAFLLHERVILSWIYGWRKAYFLVTGL